jgi:hypothetical protein
MGRRYKNELALQNLNLSVLPAVPHLIVYRDTYQSLEKFKSIKKISKRQKLVDLVGFTQINEWKKKCYPLADTK